ncbi:MAG: hypothetical protein ACK5X3_14550 [Pseudomonadota bacterium]
MRNEDYWPGERRDTDHDYPRQRSQDTVSRHMANRAEQVRAADEITRLRAELAEAREATDSLVEAVRGTFVMQNATPIGVDPGEMLGSVWPMIQAHDAAVKITQGGAKAGGDARPTGALPTEETGVKV